MTIFDMMKEYETRKEFAKYSQYIADKMAHLRATYMNGDGCTWRNEEAKETHNAYDIILRHMQEHYEKGDGLLYGLGEN